MAMDEKEISMKAKWLRNKYMGVWRRGSSLMSRVMSRLPTPMVRYMPRNRAKNMPCCSGQIGSSRRRNLGTQLWFSLLMLLFSRLGIKRKGKFQELRSTKHSSYHMVTWFLRVTVSVCRQI